MVIKKIGTSCIVMIMLLSIAVGCSSKEAEIAKANQSQEDKVHKEQRSPENKSSEGKIKFTDLVGNEIIMDKPAERLFIAMYFESLFAVGGPDILDRVASMSLGEWSDFFHSSYLAYTEAVPKLKDIHDTGSIYGNTFSMESLLQSKPDVLVVAPFQYKTLGENIKKLEDLEFQLWL